MTSEESNAVKMNEKTLNMDKSSKTANGADSQIFTNFNGNTSISSRQSLATTGDALYHKNVALFKEFIALCESIIDCSEDENKAVMRIVQRRFDCAKFMYLASEEFRSLTLSIMEKIRNSNDIFVYILDFSQELHAYKVKKHSHEKKYERSGLSQVPLTAKQSHVYDCHASDPCCSKSLPQILVSAAESFPDIVCVEVKSSKSTSTSPMLSSLNHEGKLPTSVPVDDPATEGAERIHPSLDEKAPKNSVSVDCEVSNRGAKNEIYVKNLEKALGKIHKRIQKLQQKELSLDDLDRADSYYLQEERYKKQFVKVWRLLCKHKNRSDKVRYEVERKFHFKGSRYKVINDQVEKFMNKTKRFPDFLDVYKIVEAGNIRSNLGLSESGGKSVAADIFREIGTEMKRRRTHDYIYLSGCYLTDSVDISKDPADNDEALQKELSANAIESEAKLSAIFDEFAQKQEQSKENPIEVPDDGSSPSQSEEDDDDEEQKGDDNQILDIASDDESSNDESFISRTVRTSTMSEDLYLNENSIVNMPITSLSAVPSLQNEGISKPAASTTGPTTLPKSMAHEHMIMVNRKIKPISTKNVACKLKTTGNSMICLVPDGNNNIKTNQKKLPVSEPVKPLGITQIQDLELMNTDKVIKTESRPLLKNSVTQSDIENSAVNVEKPSQTFDGTGKASMTVDEIWLSSDSDIDIEHSTMTDGIKQESLNSELTSILKLPSKHSCTKSSLSRDTNKRPSHFLNPRSDKKHAKKLCLSITDE